MIRIEIDEPTLARTRIATSPLLETICGVWLLGKDPSTVPWPYTDWVRRARQVPMPEPVRLYYRFGRMLPDFLVPMPAVPAPSFEEQIELFRRTPAEVIEAQIAIHHPHGETPPPLKPFLDDRETALNGLADGLSAWWEAVMAPYWPAMRAALDEEVLLRAQALAADGPDALLGRLHDRIRWEPPVLTVVKQLEHSFSVTDQRLLLVPLIFSHGGLPCSTDDPDVVMVTYQARGAAVLAGGPGPVTDRTDDRLSLLIGRGRATVLRALATPATTTGLATALGLAPSTVSEHLAGLQAAGVVHRRRAGRRVLYALEPAGLALVNLLGEDSAATEFVS
ncbi:helix-turn-helix domain-containing protein [Actinoplanes sp. NEAU-A12]|uniref:Helix-turn-helix domain-containing protein n=1 Tax=Actinoplanes sandaracinus TaxID=3045177 RepID=A0ABT6WEY3_9ACTN|nr:helix-turn-helix domain-containing protein [Actinoplanes sandaracinus]MDI6098296.1 helix-turn-helix domain-containing protein [Actinoplanes sandaracinus]